MAQINQLKKRNQRSRERYHNRNVVWNDFAQSLKTGEIENLLREDLETGEITVTNVSKMNSEIFWFETFHPWLNYSLPSSVAWEELKKGALLYTTKAMFRLEKVLVAQKAA